MTIDEIAARQAARGRGREDEAGTATDSTNKGKYGGGAPGRTGEQREGEANP